MSHVPPPPPAPTGRLYRRVWRVTTRTAGRAWDNSIFSKSAAAAFWQTLSLPPLLLGLLGSIGYVGGLFGPDTVDIIQRKIISFSRRTFSPNVVDQIIQPTVTDVLARGRVGFVSLGFIMTLWAGSSAMSTFVDSIVEAHGQKDSRNPVWQRLFALLLYVCFLVIAVFVLPLVALGPELITQSLPMSWRDRSADLIDMFYYPAVGLLLVIGLTTLYKFALHKTLPWHRLIGGAVFAVLFFLAASAGLRRYLNWSSHAGFSYGALTTPIAFLLFTFFLGCAIILGAEFNATIEEFWPAPESRVQQAKQWLATQAANAEVRSRAKQLATGPIRLTKSRLGRGAPEADRRSEPESCPELAYSDEPTVQLLRPPGSPHSPGVQSPERNDS